MSTKFVSGLMVTRRRITTAAAAAAASNDTRIRSKVPTKQVFTPTSMMHFVGRGRGASPLIRLSATRMMVTLPSRHCYLHPTFSTRLSSSSSTSSTSSTSSFSDIRREFREAVELYHTNVKSLPSNLDRLVQELEAEASEPNFWDADNASRNSYVTSQLSRYSGLQTRRNQWTAWKDDGETVLEILSDGGGDSEAGATNDDGGGGTLMMFTDEERDGLIEELQTTTKRFMADLQRYRLELLLSGPYDDRPCRILITAGAGGTEANDWVADLRRMYERHAMKMGYVVHVEDASPGEVVGFKSVELIVSTGAGDGAESVTGDGDDAAVTGSSHHPYGWFKGEKGTHRLVRLSPFNANNKRQTTFAGVDVSPILDEADLTDIDIPEKDLEITTMRSGGAGGQNVNKVNSAVRIKHLPSGLNVKCTQERSQAMNKDLAMQRLKAQLLAIAREQQVQEIQQIRGDQVEASWGNQIRNYVLHPYKMIKDQRTGWESSNVQNFLDGNLEECIAELLKQQAREGQEASLQES